MEVAQPKQLHKHTVPIIILGALVLTASVASFSFYAFPTASQSASHAFVTNLVSVKASPNGLAHISLAHDQAIQRATLPTMPLQDIANNVGEVTQLTVSLQSNL